ELCVWFTGPVGVVSAIAVRVLVWLKADVFAPVALPTNPGLWFCLMSRDTFAPVSVAFSFCVIEADPVTPEVSFWFWVRGLFSSHAPVGVAFPTVLAPVAES